MVRVLLFKSMIMLIKDEENHMYIPQYPNGYNNLLLPSEVDEIIDGLFMYRGTYSDEDITKYNKQNEESHFQKTKTNHEEVTKHRKGFIYILDCAGRYKVGFTKDISKRLKQLDTRPFELKLVTQYYSDNAYDIEQMVHKRLKDYKVANEWYLVDINYIRDNIRESARLLGCDIQYLGSIKKK